MTYGPEIKRGSDAWPTTDERPVWLGTGVSLGYQRDDGACYGPDEDMPGFWTERDIIANGKGWASVVAIRLPANHWSYRAIEAGFTPCNGKPADWDGGTVIAHDDSNGRTNIGPKNIMQSWEGDRNWCRIIGYHRKSTKQTVTIEKRTEAEWLDWTAARGAQRHSRGSIRFMELVRDLGLVTPPTPLERFMAEHPDADRRTAELALEWQR